MNMSNCSNHLRIYLGIFFLISLFTSSQSLAVCYPAVDEKSLGPFSCPVGQNLIYNHSCQLEMTQDQCTLVCQNACVPDTDYIPPWNVDVGFDQPLNYDQVGAIAGQPQVTPSGTASYQIPLELPPGKMQPEISLNYNSVPSNSNLGLGWSVSSNSSIHRCPTTIVKDGSSDPVDFDYNDQYCLDGQRLVKVDDYFDEELNTSVTEYRTEYESFSKIYKRFNENYFTVETQDGLTLEYGKTPDSLFLTNNLPIDKQLKWAINRVIDAAGNIRDYHYYNNQNASSHRLIEIEYGGNIQADTEHYASVVFDYGQSTRPDRIEGYNFGSRYSIDKLLRRIQTRVKIDGEYEMIKHYGINYQLSSITHAAQITSVTECDNQGSCLSPTEFAWGEDEFDSDLGLGFQMPHPNAILCQDLTIFCNHEYYKFIYYPDIDGNGRTDICYIRLFDSKPFGVDCFLSTEEEGPFSIQVTADFCDVSNPFNMLGYDYGGCHVSSHYETLRFIDINADGKDDIFYRGEQGIRVWNFNDVEQNFEPLYQSEICKDSDIHCNGNNYKQIYLGDINGDGLQDLGYRSPINGVMAHLNNGNGFNEEPDINNGPCRDNAPNPNYCNDKNNHDLIHFIDMNKDGKADLVYRSDIGIRIYEANEGPNNWSWSSWSITEICKDFSMNYGVCNDDDNYYYIHYPDINGDGLNDICYRGDEGIKCHLNTGKHEDYNELGAFDGGYISTPICANGYQYYGVCNDADNYNTIRFLDWNKDGKDDLFFRSDGGIRIFLSTGNGFEIAEIDTDLCGNGQGVCNDANNYQFGFGNVDGKGSIELLIRTDTGIQILPTKFNYLLVGLMEEITDGLDVKVNFDYRPLTDSSVYTKLDEPVAYPLLHSYGPSYVTERMRVSNGVHPKRTTKYHYTQQLTHITGHGFLGFKEVTVEDPSAHVINRTVYNQDYQSHKQGQVLLSQTLVQKDDGYVVVSETTGDSEVIAIDDGEIPRYLTLGKWQQTIERDFETEAVIRTTFQENLVYDDYGNVLLAETSTWGKDGLVFKEQAQNYYKYDLKPGVWSFDHGVLRQEKLIKMVPEETLLGQVLAAESTYDFATVEQTIGYQYDPVSGLVKKRINQPSNLGLSFDTFYEYDVFGNVVKTTEIADDAVNREVSQSYDAYGRFATETWQVANGITHLKQVRYDPKFGGLLRKISPNGHLTRVHYDSFGRETLTESADGSWNSMTYNHCDNSCPAYMAAAYYVENISSEGAFSRVYFDYLSREIRKVSKSLNGADIYMDIKYDSLGRIERKYEPYFADDNPEYWTNYEYDELDRTTQVTRPDGSVTNMDYQELAIVTTNAKGQSNTVINDVLDRTVQTIDNMGNITKHYYDATDQLRAIQDHTDISKASFIVMRYDELGRKTELLDPDMGHWHYGYNQFGELTLQRDAKGNEVWNEYDELGRLWKREEFTIDEGLIATEWLYDTQPNGIGLLTEVVSDQYGTKYYEYDALSRVFKETTFIGDDVYTIAKSYYPNSSQIKQIRYPTGFTVEHVYNSHGYLNQVVNAGTKGFPGMVYWEALSMDVRGNIDQFRLGNGVETTKYYDPATGFLQDNVSVSAGNFWLVQDEHYQFDTIGNLEERSWFTGENVYRETFQYDHLNRLRWARVYDDLNIEKQATGTSYDFRGNITYKSDVGSYVYGGSCTNDNEEVIQAGPHAVTAIINGSKNNAYCHDANGNRTAAKLKGQKLYYTSFNKIAKIEQGMNGESPLYSIFKYGVDHNLVRRNDYPWDANAEKVIQTSYIGGLYEEIKEYTFDTLQSHKHRHYIGNYAVVVFEEGEEDTAQYFHRDHLGSLVAVTHYKGVDDIVDERLSYDAWGLRRQLDLNQEPLDIFTFNPSFTLETKQGFTGHDHLDSFGLVNMKGRIYDPIIGRFIQADPYIQEPNNLQNLNRYTYVLNNPLSYTDPSGYWWKTVVSIGIGVIGIFNPAIGAVLGVAFGALVSMLENDPSAFIGAALGAVTAGVGSLINTGVKAATGLAKVGIEVAKAAVSGAVVGATVGLMKNSWRGFGRGAWTGAVFGAAKSLLSQASNKLIDFVKARKAANAKYFISEKDLDKVTYDELVYGEYDTLENAQIAREEIQKAALNLKYKRESLVLTFKENEKYVVTKGVLGEMPEKSMVEINGVLHEKKVTSSFIEKTYRAYATLYAQKHKQPIVVIESDHTHPSKGSFFSDYDIEHSKTATYPVGISFTGTDGGYHHAFMFQDQSVNFDCHTNCNFSRPIK